MREADLQAMVIELARYTGWRCHHTRSARTADGRHVTPIQGDAGYPDLTLAKPGRVVFAELKWRPDDWDLIEHTLTRRTP